MATLVTQDNWIALAIFTRQSRTDESAKVLIEGYIGQEPLAVTSLPFEDKVILAEILGFASVEELVLASKNLSVQKLVLQLRDWDNLSRLTQIGQEL